MAYRTTDITPDLDKIMQKEVEEQQQVMDFVDMLVIGKQKSEGVQQSLKAHGIDTEGYTHTQTELLQSKLHEFVKPASFITKLYRRGLRRLRKITKTVKDLKDPAAIAVLNVVTSYGGYAGVNALEGYRAVQAEEKITQKKLFHTLDCDKNYVLDKTSKYSTCGSKPEVRYLKK